jgi:adenine phosphoribosyltransferase
MIDKSDRDRLLECFAWRGDRTDDSSYADVTGWWRTPAVLSDLGRLLGRLFADVSPTVVLGVEARGFILGPLVAVTLGVSFVEVRKDPEQFSDSDAWLRRTTPPDYRDRQLTLGFRRDLVHGSDRVLLVDDWIDTGGQALGVHRLVEAAGATWLGVATVVDALESNEVRRRLNVRSLLHMRDLR